MEMEVHPRIPLGVAIVLYLWYESWSLWFVADVRWMVPTLVAFAYAFTLVVFVDLAELLIYGHLLD